MLNYIKNILRFASFFLLLSCSNRFLIADNMAAKLSAIRVELEGESITNYEFENHLNNILDIKVGDTKYRLEVKLKSTSSAMIIQKDADSARESVEFLVEYRLYEINGSNLLYSGKFRQLGSYNTLFSPYSTHIEQDKTGINLAKASAEELRRRLILYFKRTIVL